MERTQAEIHEIVAAITALWRDGRPLEMREFLHPEITMVLSGFKGTVAGRDALLAGFVEFCTHARVLAYTESEEQIQMAGNIAVASLRFDMLYERPGYRERSTGRDVWVFQRDSGKWTAVWRTMIELEEVRQRHAGE